MYKQPTAKVLAVQQTGAATVVTLQIHSELLYPPLAPASLHPSDEPGKLVLELHKAVGRLGNQVTFYSYGANPNDSPAIGQTYEFRQWCSEDQLLVAQDTSREWVRHRFVPLDSVEVALPTSGRIVRPLQPGEAKHEGATIVHGGWDHEHCVLCWQRISSYQGDQPSGYSSDGNWICEGCYSRYLQSGLGRELGDETWPAKDTRS